MLSGRWCDRDRRDLSQQRRTVDELPVEYVVVYVCSIRIVSIKLH